MSTNIAKILSARAPRFLSPRAGTHARISSYAFETRAGWAPLLYETLGKLESLMDTPEHADLMPLQIKEKFGGLRIYVNIHTDASDAIIEAAEKASEHICEWCGEPGELGQFGGSWWRTACDHPLHQNPRSFSHEDQTAEMMRCEKLILARLKAMGTSNA